MLLAQNTTPSTVTRVGETRRDKCAEIANIAVDAGAEKWQRHMYPGCCSRKPQTKDPQALDSHAAITTSKAINSALKLRELISSKGYEVLERRAGAAPVGFDLRIHISGVWWDLARSENSETASARLTKEAPNRGPFARQVGR